MSDGWIGWDLDGTLAYYASGQGIDTIGHPIPLAVDRLKDQLHVGHTVKIVTARVAALYDADAGDQDTQEAVKQDDMIREWCHRHIGQILPVTAVKDMNMIALYDDRAVTVIKNTGALLHEAEYSRGHSVGFEEGYSVGALDVASQNL